MARQFAVVFFAVFFFVSAVRAEETREGRTVYLVYIDTDVTATVMTNLVYQLKEQLRKSSRFDVTTDRDKAKLILHITGVEWDESGNAIAFGVAWTANNPLSETYLTSSAGTVGRDRTKSMAESLAAN